MPKRARSSDSDSSSNNRRRHHSPERQLGEHLHESATIIDRDGRRHVWRDTRNISERTKNLEVPFRVISHRRIPLFAPYGTLECADYLQTVQFASTERIMSAHTVLRDAGLLHRIRGLSFLESMRQFENFVQLRFEVTSNTEVLTIASFSSGSELYSPKMDSTPVFRLAVAQALKHLAIAFMVFFSSKFELCLNPLIEALEGRLNPFRIVKNDLLLHLVNTVLSKWSWYIRMENRAPNYPTINLSNPSGCATLLKHMLEDQLIIGLSGFEGYHEDLLFRNRNVPFTILQDTKTHEVVPAQQRSRVHFESVSEVPVNYCAAYLLNSMGVKTNCTKPNCVFVHKTATSITKDEAVAFAAYLNRKGRSKLGPELLNQVHNFTKWKK